jgi:biopolymer transport protein ExbB
MSALVTYLHEGGFMMYPLILCSIIAIGIILERAWTFRKATRIDPDDLLDEVRTTYRTEDGGAAAVKLLEQTPTPFARIFIRGIRNADRPPENIDMAMSQEAANEVPILENYLVGLRTIITVSPLLGLLGTIAGMIRSFKQVAAAGLNSPTSVMAGVSEALVSTATGIAVAVIALIFYNYFGNLVKRFIEDFEYYGTELTNFLTGRFA